MNQKTLWISHSAILSFEQCPRSYYYKHQYRNPNTGNRVQIASPYFSLGLAVHETIENLSPLKIEERKKISLLERYNEIWDSFSGKKGGFVSKKQEEEFKKRGEKMIKRVEKSSLLEKPSLDIKEKVPNIDLIEGEDIRLVGSLDWIEVLPNKNLHIIDFKTGNNKEKNGSLQLPIYNLLAKEKLPNKVEKVSYWYLQTDDKPTPASLSSSENDLKIIKEKAKKIKEHVEKDYYPCSYPKNCFACRDFEKIKAGEAELISSDKKDLFYILREEDIIKKLIDEEILEPREEKIFLMRVEGKKGDQISKELNLSKEKLEKIIGKIKEKMVNNLSAREVRLLVKKRF